MNDNSVSEDEGLLLAMVQKPMEIFSKGKFLGKCPKMGYLHLLCCRMGNNWPRGCGLQPRKEKSWFVI